MPNLMEIEACFVQSFSDSLTQSFDFWHRQLEQVSDIVVNDDVEFDLGVVSQFFLDCFKYPRCPTLSIFTNNVPLVM